MASQTELKESTPSAQLGLTDVMAAIVACQVALTSKVEAVQLDMGILRQDMEKDRSQLSTAEQSLGHTEDAVTKHTTALCSLKKTKLEHWNTSVTGGATSILWALL